MSNIFSDSNRKQMQFNLFDSRFNLFLDKDSVDSIWRQIKLLKKAQFAQAYFAATLYNKEALISYVTYLKGEG